LNPTLIKCSKWLCFFLLASYVHNVFANTGKIAIIIDDIGYNRHNKDFLALPTPVTFAILPFTPFAQKMANAAHQQQRDIMLHIPMQAHSQNHLLGESALTENMTKTQLQTTLSTALAELPHAIAVNNHMGSLLTENKLAMQWVMEYLFKQGIFFVDSLSSSKSVAAEQAKLAGLPLVKRNIFLDNIRTPVAMEKQFQQAIQHSHHHPMTIIIGHPYPETLAYLSQRLQKPDNQFQLVTLTELIAEQQAVLPAQKAPTPENNDLNIDSTTSVVQ